MKVGHVTIPSGTLIIVDPELLDEKGAPFVLKGFPQKGGFDVFGEASDTSPWLESVALRLGDEAGKKTVKLELPALGGALLFADSKAIKRFNEETDELSDLEFWGGDEDAVAKALSATKLHSGQWGFANLTPEGVDERMKVLEQQRAAGKKVVWGATAHTHGEKLRDLVMKSPHHCGSTEIGGAQMFLCFLPTPSAGSSAAVVAHKTGDFIVGLELSF